MTEIFLIRHTQAEGNLYHMMQGHWDGDVTGLGTRQIEALSERFRDVKIDALYSSDLYRTRMTASAITKYHDVEMKLDSRLRELNMGAWERTYFGNAIYENGDMFKKFIFDPENFSCPGAETYSQVGDRMREALAEIVEANPDKTVVVVSHGVALRCLLWKLTGWPLTDHERLPIFGNTGVARLLYENGEYTVDFINDVSHLPRSLNPVMKVPELRHVWIDPKEHEEYYKSCYEKAWLAAHGNLRDFNAQTYFDSACRHYRADGESVAIMYCDDEPAGLIDLDTERGKHADYGWISLLFLEEKYRGLGCGAQLLGRCIFRYRELGRRAVRLHVSDDNVRAQKFYLEYHQFEKIGEESGSNCKLWLLEKKI